jgi:hypothetical protein
MRRTGRDQREKFKRLAAEDRRAALQILRDTKMDLPSYRSAPITP